MAERGPDGKFLPKDEETQVAVLDPDERIAALEAQVEDQQTQIEALKPTRDVSDRVFTDPDDVVAFHGEERIEGMVADRIARQNRQRVREGLDRLPTSGKAGKELRTEIRETLIKELLEDRQKVRPPDEGWLDRTLKMVKPDGALVQIPYEVQINNVAGSLADGYVRYERKGFKRTEPMMCPSKDCNEFAAQGADGKWAFHGYCTEDHFKRTERGAAIPE